MGLRVEEGGESESQPVIGWIEIAPGDCIVNVAERQRHPTRKGADFRPVARHEKA
jgi:hypothetical protein